MREFTVGSDSTDELRHVVQCFYKSWPDYGVPQSPDVFVDYLQLIDLYRHKSQDVQAPILLHCSAGIGRTGTFCAAHRLLEMFNDCGEMDLPGTVQALRNCRAKMVQNVSQYEFLHSALAVSLLRETTDQRRNSSPTRELLRPSRRVHWGDDMGDESPKATPVQIRRQSSSEVIIDEDRLSQPSSPTPRAPSALISEALSRSSQSLDTTDARSSDAPAAASASAASTPSSGASHMHMSPPPPYSVTDPSELSPLSSPAPTGSTEPEAEQHNLLGGSGSVPEQSESDQVHQHKMDLLAAMPEEGVQPAPVSEAAAAQVQPPVVPPAPPVVEPLSPPEPAAPDPKPKKVPPPVAPKTKKPPPPVMPKSNKPKPTSPASAFASTPTPSKPELAPASPPPSAVLSSRQEVVSAPSPAPIRHADVAAAAPSPVPTRSIGSIKKPTGVPGDTVKPRRTAGKLDLSMWEKPSTGTTPTTPSWKKPKTPTGPTNPLLAKPTAASAPAAAPSPSLPLKATPTPVSAPPKQAPPTIAKPVPSSQQQVDVLKKEQEERQQAERDKLAKQAKEKQDQDKATQEKEKRARLARERAARQEEERASRMAAERRERQKRAAEEERRRRELAKEQKLAAVKNIEGMVDVPEMNIEFSKPSQGSAAATGNASAAAQHKVSVRDAMQADIHYTEDEQKVLAGKDGSAAAVDTSDAGREALIASLMGVGDGVSIPQRAKLNTELTDEEKKVLEKMGTATGDESLLAGLENVYM